MLEIRKGNPWIFWPSSICDTFPLDPANKKLNGKFSFTLDIDFTLLDDTECKKTIFSLRGNGLVDLSIIAKKYGGGGHFDASGCSMPNSVTELI